MRAPPSYPSPIVGRRGACAALAEALAQAPGLWTIAGPGGIGKTRLAAELASGWSGACWWLDLQAVSSLSQLEAVLAEAVGLSPTIDPLEAIRRRGRALLVLDSFEQLVRTCGDPVCRWLQRAPSLRLLITSREALLHPQEQVFDLGPLGGEAALALFQASAPGARIPAGQGTAIVDVLEGIPLALELAAARMSVLSCQQLLDGLAEPFRLLRRPGRDGSRHGSMYATIAWSWGALGEAEQQALAQCSVFRGGFSLQAAQAVVVLEETSVLDALHQLRDRRLLTFDGARFGMLELIRRFAEDKLDDPGAFTRHAAWAGALGRGLGLGERILRAGELRGLLPERHNLRVVLEREGIAAGDACAAGLALCALDLEHVSLSSALHLVEIVLERCEEGAPELRVEALRLRGRMHSVRGSYEAALEDLRQALSLSTSALARSRIQCLFGDVCLQMARFDEAIGWFEESAAYFEQVPELRSSGLLIRSILAEERAEVVRFEEQALEAARARGGGSQELRVLSQIAATASEAGEPERALEHARRACALGEALQAREKLPYAHLMFGESLYILGRYEESVSVLQRAEALADEQLSELVRGSAVGLLGLVALEQGQHAHGQALLDQAVEILGAIGAVRMLSTMWAGLAYAAVLCGELGAVEPAVARITEDELGFGGMGALSVCVARILRALEQGDRTAPAALLRQAEAIFEQTAPVAMYPAPLRRLVGIARAEAGAWTIAADGSWFASPAGERVEVRGAQARILAHLTSIHPEGSATLPDVVAAGWPGERITDRAARNRTHVALSGLRKLGLRSLLVTARPGWQLDPSVSIRRANTHGRSTPDEA